MIIIKFGGGLGNQIFQYALGKKLAKERNTFLASDIHWYQLSPDRDFVLDKFDIKINHLPRKVINFLNKPYLKSLNNLPVPNLYHHFFEEVTNKEIPFPSTKNLYLRGYWTLNSYFETIVDEIKDDLELKPKFYTQQYLEIKQEIKDCESVAVHIRRGDYAKNPNYNAYFGLLSTTYYHEALQNLKSKIPNLKIFVFSDDPDWVKENMAFLKDTVFVSDQVGSVDYLEFDLMKNCKHQVTANSTFSWWAARLNSNPKKIIIQPKRWYEDEEAQRVYEEKKSFYVKNAILL